MSTGARARPADRSTVDHRLLGFALMGGATAWLLRLIVNSSLVEYACDIDATWPVWTTTLVATAVAGAALAISWRFRSTTGPSADSTRWLGLLAIMFNVLAIIGILFETLPVFVFDLCASVPPF